MRTNTHKINALATHAHPTVVASTTTRTAGIKQKHRRAAPGDSRRGDEYSKDRFTVLPLAQSYYNKRNVYIPNYGQAIY